jgi:hypothetical protein
MDASLAEAGILRRFADWWRCARPVPQTREPCEVRPRDLWCMNIPWDECDIEGEVDVKLRFRKKCKLANRT